MTSNINKIDPEFRLPNLRDAQALKAYTPPLQAESKAMEQPRPLSSDVVELAGTPEEHIQNAAQLGMPASLEQKEIKRHHPQPVKPQTPTVAQRLTRALKGAFLAGVPGALTGGTIGLISGMWGGPGNALQSGLAGMALGGLGGGLIGGTIAGLDDSPYGYSQWDQSLLPSPGYGNPGFGYPGIGFPGMGNPGFGGFPGMGWTLPYMLGWGNGFMTGALMNPLGMGGFGMMGMPFGSGGFGFGSAGMYSSLGGALGTLGGGLIGGSLGYMQGGPWGGLLGGGLGMMAGNAIGSTMGGIYGMTHPSYGRGGYGGFPGMIF